MNHLSTTMGEIDPALVQEREHRPKPSTSNVEDEMKIIKDKSFLCRKGKTKFMELSLPRGRQGQHTSYKTTKQNIMPLQKYNINTSLLKANGKKCWILPRKQKPPL
ncbi:hypothetical protein V6N11_038157 [Hibiscus sabdariffa]|uniref:Uncharacterized protein n=1 Tax=Hibiscus sabdariffa TaxID=183260 RepID=A0ABR2SJ93_9ROSI